MTNQPLTNQPFPADHFTPDGVFLIKPKHRDVALGLTRYSAVTSESSFLRWFIFFLITVLSVGAVLSLLTGGTLNGLILAVIAISIVGYSVLKFQHDRRLEQNGQLIRGILLEIKGDEDSDGDYYITGRYRFQSPHGLPLEGRYQISTDSDAINKLKNYTLPPAGIPVAVWYADDTTYTIL